VQALRSGWLMASKHKARLGLAIFFATLILGTTYIERKVFLLGGTINDHLGLIYALGWWVTVSSLVARLVLWESLRDVSFRWGGRAGTRAMMVATGMPLAVGFVAYGIAWSSGLAHFHALGPSDTFRGMHLAGAPATRFLKYLLLWLTVGAVDLTRYAAGEEIGWRGYMLTRLIDADVPAPILVSGIVWAAWHMPLILSGQYASGPHPTLSAIFFTIDTTALAVVIAWLRLSSGSIWPCIWAHCVWNEVIEGAFDLSTEGYSMWVGESGILCATATIIFAIVLFKVWPLRSRAGSWQAEKAP
jgi:uncharacterized protein